MEWWKGVEETRLLVAPGKCGVGNGEDGCLLSLRNPKTGKATCYLLNGGTLQEIHWFKQPYTSWFIGDYVCEDGGLYAVTPVDPIFVLLPIFDKARMKKGSDPGKFRQMDEIIFVDDYPGYQHLYSIAEACMQLVCEIKEVGSMKFFRLDDSKVLAWLYCKVCRLVESFPSLGVNYAAQDEKSRMADAVKILSEYLNDDPWLKLLCQHMELNLLDATSIIEEVYIPLTTTKSNQLPLWTSNLPVLKALLSQIEMLVAICLWRVHPSARRLAEEMERESTPGSRVPMFQSLPTTNLLPYNLLIFLIRKKRKLKTRPRKREGKLKRPRWRHHRGTSKTCFVRLQGTARLSALDETVQKQQPYVVGSQGTCNFISTSSNCCSKGPGLFACVLKTEESPRGRFQRHWKWPTCGCTYLFPSS